MNESVVEEAALDWLAVSQFTVTEDRHVRRPDVVLFINGLPLALIELKNAVAENATIWTAFQQLQTYRAELPTLFAFNELLVISDGMEARSRPVASGSSRGARSLEILSPTPICPNYR